MPSAALTREFAQYACSTDYRNLPALVQKEAGRAFLNWMGCALGGCTEPAVRIAYESSVALGHGESVVVGFPQRLDMAGAAFVNCISSSIMAFDDAHLATVTHPSGPAGAALLALAGTHQVSGEEFLNALALGIEVQCRLSNLIALPPSNMKLGFYVTGLTGPIGVAAAAARLLRLDEIQTNWALGIAASQSSGFRASHGTMTAHFRPGHAARCGVWSALLASRGFDCDEHSLEAEHGFVDVFASSADHAAATRSLGTDFEILRNAYKPYPCGIVIHPALDACLEVMSRAPAGAAPEQVVLKVHPLALKLTGVRHPRNTLESHISLYHWASAVLLRGAAGLEEMSQQCIDDPQLTLLRSRIEAIPVESLQRGEAIAEVRFSNGEVLGAHVRHVRGSAERPMTDAELLAKFLGQAIPRLGYSRAERLADLCRSLASLGDAGKEIESHLLIP